MERPMAGRTAGERTPTVHLVSAGGVAFQRGGDGPRVVLVRVGLPGRWQLPKGLVEPGETREEAARREVREEAGIDATPLAPLDSVEFFFSGRGAGGGFRVHKRVYFFLMEYVAGDVADHDREVEEARWFTLDEAAANLTYGNERAVLSRARALIES